MSQLVLECPRAQCWVPLCFSYKYINDINNNITSSKLGLFADDSVIYKTIYSKDDSITLQNDLRICHIWLGQNLANEF